MIIVLAVSLLISEKLIVHDLVSSLSSRGFSDKLLSFEGSPQLIYPLPLSKKRFDLLYFYDLFGDLRPLLLIECKKNSKALRQAKTQVVSYNLFLEAPFIAVVSSEREEITSPKKDLRNFLAKRSKAIVSDNFLGLDWWNKIPNYNELIDFLILKKKQLP